jgi:hypothetical protein
MPRRLVVLLLLLAMVPALGEIVELVAHAAVHGDVAHAVATDDDHDEAPIGTDEHGCSPVMHFCGCHASTPLIAQESGIVPDVRGNVERAGIPLPRACAGIEMPTPPTRPPIA